MPLKCHLFLLVSVSHHLVHDRLLALPCSSCPVHFIDRKGVAGIHLCGFPCCSTLFPKKLGLQEEAPLGDYCVCVCVRAEREQSPCLASQSFQMLFHCHICWLSLSKGAFEKGMALLELLSEPIRIISFEKDRHHVLHSGCNVSSCCIHAAVTQGSWLLQCLSGAVLQAAWLWHSPMKEEGLELGV